TADAVPDAADVSESDALIESPGETPTGTCVVGCGKTSYQAWYAGAPEPLITAWVPTWIRSRVFTPPMPTHVASACVPLALTTVGTVHVPLTAVKVPPVASYPDQLKDWLGIVVVTTGEAPEDPTPEDPIVKVMT